MSTKSPCPNEIVRVSWVDFSADLSLLRHCYIYHNYQAGGGGGGRHNVQNLEHYSPQVLYITTKLQTNFKMGIISSQIGQVTTV